MTLTIQAPNVGVAKGTVVIRADADGVCILRLGVVAETKVGSGCVVAPSEVEIARDEWSSGWTGVFAIRVGAGLLPRGQTNTVSVAGPILRSRPSDWVDLSGHAFACSVHVTTLPLGDTGEHTLTLSIPGVGQRSVRLKRWAPAVGK